MLMDSGATRRYSRLLCLRRFVWTTEGCYDGAYVVGRRGRPELEGVAAKGSEVYGRGERSRISDVTPLAYGDQFHGWGWVNGAAMEVIREFGGRS